MMRLRTGNAVAAGAATPKPDSLTSRPGARTRSNSTTWRRGYTTSRPVATTPDDPAAGVERAVVGGAVDADGEAAHDRDARGGEDGAELAGVGEPVRGCGAGADDRDTRAVERVAAPSPSASSTAGRSGTSSPIG